MADCGAGNMDATDNFNIEMDVLPNSRDHDGNLFAIGSKRVFPYYEWRTKANSTQYLVVEIVYSSVSLLGTTDNIPSPNLWPVSAILQG